MWKKVSVTVALLVAVVVSSLLGLTANAQALAQAQTGELELTVYNQNFALVKDRRTLDLDEGLNEVSLSDVASRIDPTSVLFRSLTDPEGTRVIEQNYEYDIVNSAKLFEKYIDEQIRLVTEDGTGYEGTLLNGRGDVILRDKEGGITVVKPQSIREFSFPELPAGLITKPTLVWLLDSGREGSQETEVTYLTDGLNWHAEYVVSLAPEGKLMDLKAWVTIDNQSGATYKEAGLKLMAGDVRRVRPQPQYLVRAEMEKAVAAGAPQFEEEAFFEYHRYTLQRPATIKQNQTKQIELASAADVPIDKFFVYDGAQMGWLRYGYSPLTEPQYGPSSNKKVFIMLEFLNSEAKGLGIPLPKGTVRVYQNDERGGADFVGEDSIDHTPKDEKVRLYVGNAFDLVGERKQTDFKKIGRRVIEESFEISLRNHKDRDEEIRVVEHLYRWTNWELLKSSHDYERLDARTIEFRVEVPANDEVKVTYTVRYSW